MKEYGGIEIYIHCDAAECGAEQRVHDDASRRQDIARPWSVRGGPREPGLAGGVGGRDQPGEGADRGQVGESCWVAESSEDLGCLSAPPRAARGWIGRYRRVSEPWGLLAGVQRAPRLAEEWPKPSQRAPDGLPFDPRVPQPVQARRRRELLRLRRPRPSSSWRLIQAGRTVVATQSSRQRKNRRSRDTSTLAAGPAPSPQMPCGATLVKVISSVFACPARDLGQRRRDDLVALLFGQMTTADPAGHPPGPRARGHTRICLEVWPTTSQLTSCRS